MIKIKNLSCSFDEKNILKNINLNIPSHLNILGANGSGKSTLAKCLTNLCNYSGEVFIDDANIKNISLKDLAKTLAYIPTKLDLYDEFISVQDFILLSRYAHKKSFLDYAKEDLEIVNDAIKTLNIEHLASHSVSSLSSGEQQLSLIACALASKSKIIIFDEPTANLDPKNSKIIAKHIKALKDTLSIILITHDLQLAFFINSPTLFIKNTEATLYENEFYDAKNLEALYEVSFNDLAVKYE